MSLEQVQGSRELDPQPVKTPDRIPMGTILGEMADAMDATKKSFDKYKKVTVTEPLKHLKEQLTQLTVEEEDALRKVAEAKEHQNLWSYGHVISSLGYAALSIVFGSYLWATGEEQGKKLIYGGSALLANTLMDHLGGWNFVSKLASLGHETFEQGLRTILPIAATLTTMIYTTTNIANLPEATRAFIKNIDRFVAWVNVAVQVANTWASWKLGQAQRTLTLTESKITANLMSVEPLNIRNETLTNTSKQISDTLKGGIKKIIKGTSAIPMAV